MWDGAFMAVQRRHTQQAGGPGLGLSRFNLRPCGVTSSAGQAGRGERRGGEHQSERPCCAAHRREPG